MQLKSLQYAHDEGHTDVCFSSDGSKFITCGADGDIRIWSNEEGEDPVHNCVGEWALCVRQKDENLFVATGSNDIQKLTFPEGQRNGVLDRFVAPINHIAISKTSEHIALAGEDMEVKLFDTSDASKCSTIFKEATGPCLSVALSPNVEFVASASGDGKLRVWNVSTKAVVHEISCFPKVNSFSNAKNLCRIDFDATDGKYLAYPDKNTIKLIKTSDWSEKACLKTEKVTSDFSIVEFSPCSKFVLGATLEGDFVVFRVDSGAVANIAKHENAKTICGLAWNPSNNGQVVYTDADGQLGEIKDVIDAESQSEANENDVDFGDVQFEESDDENAVSLEKIKKQVMGDDVDSELNFDENKSSRGASPRPRTPEVPLQAAFMPSATPEHLNPRYLCWNDVGIIRSYSDEASKSIEVEFHDSSFHHSMMLQNFQDYTMGTVSKSALIVANSSQIHVIPLSASTKEWSLKLDNASHEVLLVAATENLVAFVTSNYLLRICSIFGTQRAVVAIPGPVVSMSGFSSNLLVAYHAGAVRAGEQCIGLKMYAMAGMQVSGSDFRAELGPEGVLQWMGFSDTGRPVVMDSLGMIFAFASQVWVPICDTTRHRKSPSDGFFITSVLESRQSVCGIKCKGSIYPGIIPQPICCELPLEAPFVEYETEKSQMEANLFTWSSLQMHEMSKKVIETGLKTFALALRNNCDQRAIEFVEMTEVPQILTLAPKYALKLNKKLVAEKLMELATKLLEIGDETTIEATNTPEPAPFRRKLTLNSLKKTQRNKLIAKENKEVITSSETENNEPEPTISSSSLMDSKMSLSYSSLESPQPVEHKNPFLKSLKKDKNDVNPLSLTDKSAGIEYENGKEKKVSEKRKQPAEPEPPKQKEKQRKLDKFMFSSTKTK